MKKFFFYKFSFFVLVVILFWVKMYLFYKIEFNFGVKGIIQEIFLVFNLFLSVVFFLGLVLFVKGCKLVIIMLIIDFVMIFVLYVNILFYCFFDDFLIFLNIK